MKKQDRKYYDILTTESANEATILLYGYIGEWLGWDDEKGWTQKGVTDVDFVQELERLSAKYPVIHVRINSPGGEIFHGSAIVTAIRNCAVEVHTWIDGVAASMAGVIWMAGKKRHMAKNGMLMIHSASGICWGNAADMREMASTLDAFDQSLISAAADATGMSEEDMKKKYFDGKDHWLTWNDVSAEGWLSAAAAPEEEEEEYTAATGKMPENAAKMNYRDLVAWFEKENHPQASDPGFLKKVKAFFDEAAALFGGNNTQPSPSPAEARSAKEGKNTLDMNIEELKKSLADGTLEVEAVKAVLAEQQPPAEPAATEGESIREIRADLDAALLRAATLEKQMADTLETLKAYGAKPGAAKSAPGMPDADLPTNDGAQTPEARLKAANDAYAKAAAGNEPVQFTLGN